MSLSEGFTKSQIDRLGDRLRKRDISEADLRLLDAYRRSFADASEFVFAQIRDHLGLKPTGRPAKSTTSIIEKVRREKTRLSTMQDIAGCRVIVPDILTQDEVVARLNGLFDRTTVVDRREHPSHGYRAVHVIVDRRSKLVEVQVRTSLQHAWAQLSEKLADEVDSTIKYGGGDKELVSHLATMSDASMDMELAIMRKDGERMTTELLRWSELFERLQKIIGKLRGEKDDISD
jgi:ppGpp synthetase/RelA/SpoT-type nucleotidyltranferase